MGVCALRLRMNTIMPHGAPSYRAVAGAADVAPAAYIERGGYRTRAPNGSSDSFAILNDCRPKGMPMMVMQLNTPASR